MVQTVFDRSILRSIFSFEFLAVSPNTSEFFWGVSKLFARRLFIWVVETEPIWIDAWPLKWSVKSEFTMRLCMATEPQSHASLEIGFAMFGKVFTSLLNSVQTHTISNIGNTSIQQHAKLHRLFFP